MIFYSGEKKCQFEDCGHVAYVVPRGCCLPTGIGSVLRRLVASLLLLASVFAFHMSIIPCSPDHTLPSLLRCYVSNQVYSLRYPFIKAKLRREWRSPQRAQETFLRQLIARDAETEYGLKFRLGDIENVAELQRKHPLTSYEDYREYMQRLADGERGVCVGEEVVRFGITSGTTGVGKLIPIVASRTNVIWFSLSEVVFPANEAFGRPSPLQRRCTLYCKPTLNQTKSGRVVSPLFFVSPSDQFTLDMSNTPPAGFQISTDFEANYVHLLFALRDRHIGTFLAPFTALVYRAMKLIEDNWQTLLDDITKGRLNPELAISDEIRRDLNAALSPNPERAGELRAEFSKGFVGIVSRMWPNFKHIFSVEMGGFRTKLDKTYTKGTPIYQGIYMCTETCIGMNLWPTDPQAKYSLLVNENIYEFIREENCKDENPQTLLIDEVEVGQTYELVLTTRCGLYRYRNGDVVKVVGIHEKCPVIKFEYRKAELLNLRSEKVTAVTMQTVVQEFMSQLPGARLVNWTCAESPLLSDTKGGDSYEIFYLVFIEVENVSPLENTTEWAPKFDQVLRRHHHFYNYLRNSATLAMAHVHQVKPGSFDKLKEFIVANSSASVNQFKSPRKLRDTDVLELMMSHIM
ncbi:probable indole-3-acetic acid-amido synthetase GH3.9 isoform X2 [Patiria miniata]|uniref:GH3 domain-containing protein n=1 Tax=Patiria miniata TaxID=46514 RepID=A0A914B3Y0_PATMI|nr:probable indole-3-acetic acid-amido synthetase GH3.9 isoform X2 [Patiria miniata]